MFLVPFIFLKFGFSPLKFYPIFVPLSWKYSIFGPKLYFLAVYNSHQMLIMTTLGTKSEVFPN